MKLKVSVLALLMLSGLSSAIAQDCNKVKTEVDKFTKTEIKSGKVSFGKIKLVKSSTKWFLQVNQEKGETEILVSVASLGEFNQQLDGSSSFYFLLDNGEVLQFENVVPADPVTQAVANGAALTVFTTYQLTLMPSKEELKKLGSGIVTDVKVDIPNQTFQVPEVGKKDAREFQSIINCIALTAK